MKKSRNQNEYNFKYKKLEKMSEDFKFAPDMERMKIVLDLIGKEMDEFSKTIVDYKQRDNNFDFEDLPEPLKSMGVPDEMIKRYSLLAKAYLDIKELVKNHSYDYNEETILEVYNKGTDYEYYTCRQCWHHTRGCSIAKEKYCPECGRKIKEIKEG